MGRNSQATDLDYLKHDIIHRMQTLTTSLFQAETKKITDISCPSEGQNVSQKLKPRLGHALRVIFGWCYSGLG